MKNKTGITGFRVYCDEEIVVSPKVKDPESPRVQALHERTILEILPHEEVLNVIDNVGRRNLVDT